MARFSKHKPAYLQMLTSAFPCLVKGAENASRLDQVAVDHAAKALAMAIQWTRDGAEISRGRMREQTALLERAASESKTPRAAGLFQLAQAFRAFAANEYANVARFSEAARKA